MLQEVQEVVEFMVRYVLFGLPKVMFNYLIIEVVGSEGRPPKS